jgi:hypothetical protein
MRTLYLLDNLAKWIILPISNHFVLTRAAASLSSQRKPDRSQESQRIREGRQVRLAHTCDSFSESLMRHLIVAR